MNKLNNISIIITTLGGNDLNLSLSAIFQDLDINSNFEVLIIIPSKNEIPKNIIQNSKIKIISTYFPGQVHQRIVGFRNATKDYVLQIDDDVEISSKDIINLKDKLDTLENNSAISPLFFNRHNRKNCIYNLYNNNFLLVLKNILTLIICKSKWGIKRSGTLTMLGTNYGVDYKSFKNKEIIEVDWLPGGCVLHLNKNLHKFDYYPFKGKAYCEDLLHSLILKNNNINLYVYKNAKCFTDLPLFPQLRTEKIKFLRAYNFYYLKSKKINVRYLLWYLINLIRVVF